MHPVARSTSQRPAPFVAACAFLALVPSLATAVAAQTVVVNPPFVREGVVGAVRDFRIHPAGGHVLFRADFRYPEVLELLRVPIDGSARPAQVVPLGPFRAVQEYELSANGQWLVYVADADSNGLNELFSHRVGTFGSRKLNGPVVLGGVTKAVVTDNSARVLYLADIDSGNDAHQVLFSVPIDAGAAAVQLSPGRVTTFAAGAGRVAFADAEVLGSRLFSAPIAGGSPALDLGSGEGTIQWLKLTPDGRTAVYYQQAAVSGLWSVPLDGSRAPVRLGPFSWNAAHVLVSPDGTRVVYRDSQELHSVPIDGGPAVRLDDPLDPSSLLVNVAIPPGSNRVVYIREREPVSPRLQELRSVPIDGSSLPALLDGPTDRQLGPLVFAPDGSRVVYRHGNLSLNSVQVDGGAAPVVLAGPGSRDVLVTPDSAHVVYVHQHLAIRRVPIDGSAPPTEVAAGAAGAARALSIAPGQQRVVFLANTSGDIGVGVELYSAPLAGGGATKLSAELAHGIFSNVAHPAFARAFVVDAAGERVVFSADMTTDEFYELYAARVDGSGDAVPLGGEVLGTFELSADRRRVVYVCEPTGTSTGGRELRSALLDGSAPPVRLDAPSAETVSRFLLAPDDSRVAYLQGLDLRSVPLAGGAPVTLAAGVGLWDAPRITADSSWLLFVPSPPMGLFRVPLDGSAGPVALDSATTARAVQPTPDGTRALYARGTLGRPELWSVPVDGSAAPVWLSQGTDRVGERPAVLSPDSRWALFVGEPPARTSTDLYARRVDGSGAAILLSAGTPGTLVSDMAFTSDSARVVYIAYGASSGRNGLYLVPVDGSAAPVELTDGPGGIAGSVANWLGMRISADGSHAVFAAYEPGQYFDLFSVPLVAGAVAVRLGSEALTLGSGFELGLDSSVVVFSATRDGFGWQLFQAPLDGSRAPLAITPSPANCLDFRVTPDSRRVVYRAMRTEYVIELLSSELPVIPKQRHLAPR